MQFYCNCCRMSKTGLLPANIILHGTCIPIPLPLFTAFPVISTVAELIVSVRRKKNFRKLSAFPFIKCTTTLSLLITATAYLSTTLSGFIRHCKTSPTKRTQRWVKVDFLACFKLKIDKHDGRLY